MKTNNIYKKIPKKNYTDILNNNTKLSSRLKTINRRAINSNFKTFENDTSELNSYNKINYSACNEYNPLNFTNINLDNSNKYSNHKLTYVLTTNDENSNFDEKKNI